MTAEAQQYPPQAASTIVPLSSACPQRVCPPAGRATQEISLWGIGGGHQQAVRGSAQQQQLLLYRGLRLKAGVHMGPMEAALSPVSGCMVYRGKAAMLASRISSNARAGQVRQCWFWLERASTAEAQLPYMEPLCSHLVADVRCHPYGNADTAG